MKPVDEVDELLTRAGARWRADQEPPPEPDLDYILGGGRKRRRWVPALAAASVAVIAAGVITLLPNQRPDQGSATGPVQGTNNSPQPYAAGSRQPNDDLLVRPGDMVKVSGQVIAAPGKDPIFCGPHAITLPGYLPGNEPAPSCPADLSVTLRGVDLDRLDSPVTTKGVRTGRATLIGIWGDRSIDVQEQTAYVAPQSVTLPPLACPRPQGGWPSKPNNLNSPAVLAFLNAHSAEIADPFVQYPEGHGRGKPVVVQVGVAHGDLAAFRRAFEQVYDGNLCVANALLSRGDSNRIYQALAGVTGRADLGITVTSGSTPGGGPAEVQLLAYTEAVKAAIAPVGLDLLTVEPAVTPVR